MKKNKRKQLLISVVMPVYNAGKFLSEAINSILHQTYENFEFIIVDDASTDNSWQIIKNYTLKDNRIKAFQNKKNSGVSATTNFAISKTKGQFIARMDADDVSFPTRFEKQLNYLQTNKNTIAVGGQCVVIDEKDQIIGQKIFPLNNKKLRKMIFRAVPMQQPSIIINRNLLPENFQWYSPACSSAEELDVLFKLMKYGKIANLKDWTLFYRYRPTSLSHINPKRTFWFTLKSRLNGLKLGFKPSFTAIIVNLFQLITVTLLPNKTITILWYLIRGIKKPKVNLPELNPKLESTAAIS